MVPPPRSKRASISIVDVAAAAGVSLKTASRVLNSERYVGADKTERVLSAVKSLGFRKNVQAARLRDGRSLTLGLVFYGPERRFWEWSSEVYSGAHARCQERGFGLISTVYQGLGDTAADFVKQATERSVDGLILTSPWSELPDIIAELDGHGITYVLVGPGPTLEDRPHVISTEPAAAAAMMRRVVDFGHRRIGLLYAYPDLDFTKRWLAGSLAALLEHGMDMSKVNQVAVADWFEVDAAAMQALLGGRNAPTAVVASNDLLAASVMQNVWSRRLRVPDDLSVTGFLDLALSRHLSPDLTTVRIPSDEVGAAAADLLIDVLTATGGPRRRMIEATLIERRSLAAPPARSIEG